MLHHRISTSSLSRNSRKKTTVQNAMLRMNLLRIRHKTSRRVSMWMFRRRRTIQRNVTIKMLHNKKIPLYQVPQAAVKVTVHALKWIFLLVLLYLTLGFIMLLVQDGMRSVADVIVYSIIGFVTFFAVYFGWLFTRDAINVVTGKKIQNENPEL